MSETWSSNKKKCRLTGFNFIEEFRRNGYGGTAIAVRKDLKANRIPFSGKGEHAIGKIFVGKKSFVIASMYIAPSVFT